jgi:iron complex transport system substrate-binding protein
MTVPAPRIASLLPSATEMVCALGLGARLVGVSHECDHPAEDVRGKRVLTASKVLSASALGATSAAVDRDVRRVLKDALAVYDVDVDGLREAAPDVIVTQDLCDVCAVSIDDVRAAVRALELGPDGREPVLVNLHPTRLADVLDDRVRVGVACGRGDVARTRRAELAARIEVVALRAERCVSNLVRGGGARPAVLTIEWLDPVMIGGTWMPELVELAGGSPLVTAAGDHAPTLGAEELDALAPDVVLIKPCGFALERTLAEAELLRALLAPRAERWPAVRTGRVFVADGNAYFNRPGPRIVESLEILAACLWPAELADLAERHRDAFVRFDATRPASEGTR